MAYEQLKLENQLCFSLFAASHLITRRYKPQLEKLGITYPQYLVLLVLWEEDNLSVNDIAAKLILNTNTIMFLLKQMDKQGLIDRRRSDDDERRVLVCLSEKGMRLREAVADIPARLAKGLIPEVLSVSETMDLKGKLHRVMRKLIEEEDESGSGSN